MAKVRLWVDAAAGPGTGAACDDDALTADAVTGEADRLSPSEARDEVKPTIPSPMLRRVVTEVIIDRYCCCCCVC